MSKSSRTGGKFSDNITLMYGPAPVLAGTILAAESLCAGQGVTLEFATAAEFQEINQRNSDSWLPVFRGFDHRYSRLGDDNSFFILGRDRQGDVVACQAARLYVWDDTNAAAEFQSMRVQYSEPKQMALPGEQWRTTSLAARGTIGRVTYSGGAWYRRDFRRRGLVQWLPRLSRALARGLWDTRTTITLMSEANVAKGVYPRNGYRNLEWAVVAENSNLGTLRLAYLWSKDDEMIADLESFLDSLGNEEVVDRRVGTK